MNGFHYRDGQLYADDVPISTLAQTTPTPFYCYSRTQIQHNYRHLENALHEAGLKNTQICYALKANSNLAVIAALAECGAGGDIVSGGELVRAMKGGIAPDKIVFSGVGKTAAEIDAALTANIARFNVESMSEIDMLSQRAKALGKRAHVSARINPDIKAGGHAKMSTGKAEDKFGIAWHEADAAYAHITAQEALVADGIDIHIGSQICALAPFKAAFTRLADLLAHLRGRGHTITHLDVGGGLGIAYEPNATPLDIAAYARLVQEELGQSDCHITFEPGRALVADAGVLITRIIRTKPNFLIVDASMSELIRPTLYDAYHHIAPVIEPADNASDSTSNITYDIVGAVCETGDFLGHGRTLPPLQADDLLSVFCTGAYGQVQASNYNTRPRAAEIMVAGAQHEIVRPRETLDAMLAGEITMLAGKTTGQRGGL